VLALPKFLASKRSTMLVNGETIPYPDLGLIVSCGQAKSESNLP
jgi:hypothetical protein